jgi:hypothetical protein
MHTLKYGPFNRIQYENLKAALMICSGTVCGCAVGVKASQTIEDVNVRNALMGISIRCLCWDFCEHETLEAFLGSRFRYPGNGLGIASFIIHDILQQDFFRLIFPLTRFAPKG